MSKFAQAMNASAYTWNGATSYASPDPSGEATGRLSLFFKGVRGLNVPRLYEYLRVCSGESLLDTFLLVFHLRDCRGGKGERELGRRGLVWLFVNYPDQFRLVTGLLSEYGRWDDLLEFFPGALKLSSIEEVRANYEANVPHENHLNKLRTLQNDIVQIMATQLKKDRDNMLNGLPCSLCAKWTPTEGDSDDRKNSVFATLAAAVGISPRALRKDYNTPLRSYLKIVENYMCSGKWDDIDFNKVPSHAMKRLKTAFEKHDPVRFAAWRDALKLGDPKVAKVNGKQLHPHELVGEMRKKSSEDAVTEAQWKEIVADVRKLGSLRDAVVVVDTSSSMHSPNYLPIDVAVAMGMLVSEVVEGDFHGHVISFSDDPRFSVVPDGTAYNRYRTITAMNWGGSTNLQKTFELILRRGVECKLSQADMPKRLIIVSDMQFNEIDRSQTNWEYITELYRKSGYTRPQIIFWNVNGSSTDFPVTTDERGTALISGFSPAILKSLIKGDDYTPMSVLRSTIDDPRYDLVRTAFTQDQHPGWVANNGLVW